jgi:hypothetical protein
VSYSGQIIGFSQMVAPQNYGGPVTHTGAVSTTFSTTMLTQADTIGDSESGTLTKLP